MKVLSLGMIIPMTPPIVQKKLLFELLKLAKITLSKEELESLEKLYTPPEIKTIPVFEVKRNVQIIKDQITNNPEIAIAVVNSYIEHLTQLEKNDATRR